VLLRALVVWFVLLMIAVANGAFREAALVPRMGSAVGHVVSTVLLCTFITLLAWLTVPWIDPTRASEAWTVGLLWLILTLAFEFLAGHYLFGTPWPQLLADYNVAQGRIWPLVLVTTFLAPWVVFRLSGPR
jgi:hypothetical protein